MRRLHRIVASTYGIYQTQSSSLRVYVKESMTGFAAEACPAEVCLPEVCPEEIYQFIWMLCSPRIPYVRALPENIKLLLVGHSAYLACVSYFAPQQCVLSEVFRAGMIVAPLRL